MQAYSIAIAIMVLIYMLLALGLNLQYGYTGLINFGHVAFFAIGAYASALLSMNGWPMFACFLAAMVIAALAAGPIGALSLRLSDDYFAIVTLGFSESVRMVIDQETWLTNGVQGLAGIPKLFHQMANAGYAELATLASLVACVAAVAFMTKHLARSPYGRLIQAIRDDETAVQTLGKNPARLKIQVFMLGAALAGLAGSFYAHFITYLSPEQFVSLITFYVWIAVIIGGVGRTSGVLLGSALLIILLEGSRFLRDILPGIEETQMASLRLAFVGLALILFTIYRPQGLLGKRKD